MFDPKPQPTCCVIDQVAIDHIRQLAPPAAVTQVVMYEAFKALQGRDPRFKQPQSEWSKDQVAAAAFKAFEHLMDRVAYEVECQVVAYMVEYHGVSADLARYLLEATARKQAAHDAENALISIFLRHLDDQPKPEDRSDLDA